MFSGETLADLGRTIPLEKRKMNELIDLRRLEHWYIIGAEYILVV